MAKEYSTRWGKSILETLINDGLLSALYRIGKRVEDEKVPSVVEQYDRILIPAKYMLHYLRKGTLDKGRQEMYDNLCGQVVDLVSSIEYVAGKKDSTESFFNVARTLEYSGRTLEQVYSDYYKVSSLYAIMAESGEADENLMQQRERGLADLFEWVWGVQTFSQDDTGRLIALCSDKGESYAAKCMIVAGCFLSLMKFYNSSKFRLLLDIYNTCEDDLLSARAMISIVMVLNRYGETAVFNREIKDKLESWQDSLLSYSRLREVEMALISAYDTDRVTRNFSNNLLPDMMKYQPRLKELMKGLDLPKDDPEKMMESIESLGFNPEWEKFMSESGLEDKMKEMSQLIEQGGDVMYSTFRGMKSHNFFRSVANWFAPFENLRSGMPTDSLMMSSLLQNTGTKMMCDSDKYSLAFMMGGLNSRLSGLGSGMAMELSEFEKGMEGAPKADRKFSEEAGSYAKDLYRFFTLHSSGKEYGKPFSSPVLPDSLPVIGDVLFDNDFKRLVYEFFFRTGYYRLALFYLEGISKTKDADYFIFQKAGYCHQMTGNNEKALEYYQRALLFDKEAKWINTAIGNVYFNMRDYENASSYFNNALKTDPEDKDLLMKMAKVNLEAGKPDLALSYYYKVDYITPCIESARGIAWGEFLRNDPLKSLEYSERIFSGEYNDGEIKDEDYIRAGHVSLSVGNIKDAIGYYEKVKSKKRLSFLQDWPVLEKKGVAEADFRLCVESVFLYNNWTTLSDLTSGSF